MPHPCPHHCPPERAGLGVLAVLVAVVVLAAIARPVVHAAETVLEVALIVAGALLGLAGIGGVAFLALRARSRPATNRQAMSQHVSIAQRRSQAVLAPRRLAIEATRPSLADIQALAAERGYDVIRKRGETTED